MSAVGNGTMQLHEQNPELTARVMAAVRRSKRKDGLTATNVGRRCGLPPSNSGKDDPDVRMRVQGSYQEVRVLLGYLVDIGWLERLRGRGGSSYRLASETVREQHVTDAGRNAAAEDVCRALGVLYDGTPTVYIRAEEMPDVRSVLLMTGLVASGPPHGRAITLTLTADEATLIRGLLEPARIEEAVLLDRLGAAVARAATRRLGVEPCPACSGGGVVSHTDYVGYHSWPCDRCGGSGDAPGGDPAASTATPDLQRRARRLSCSPDCPGYRTVRGFATSILPSDYIQVVGCRKCGLYRNREAALAISADRAIAVDVRSGVRRPVIGSDAWMNFRNLVYAIPVEDVVALDLALPAAGGDGG
jgi:hypothetical protein